ncbi:hypothetical protein BKA93DRAFT_727485 [Sparassis latifolia]
MLAPLGPSPPPATAGISLNDCKTTVKVRNRAFMGHPSAFKSITIEVTSPDRKKVASIFAYQINRAVCDDGDFLCIMDADSDELATLSRVLFDKYGEVRPWLVEDELFKGTGCWGRELSRGKLVYVQIVYVSDESMRGQGLGSFALQSLLNSEHVTENDFVISWPTPDPPRYDKVRSTEQYEAEMHRAVSFYQKNGFRRIGLTQFLAYSPRLDHPSHNISPSNDAKFLQPRVELSAKEDLLAHTLSGAWATLEQIIRAAFLQDQTSITQKDNKGFTPLHRAAESLNVIATKILLELGVQEDLLRRDNMDLKTPMMLCTDQLRVFKELQEIKQGRWVGHGRGGLQVEAMLKRAMGNFAGTDIEYIQQYKWGCTCGRCAGGWLSPRVRQGLRGTYCADYLYDTMPSMQGMMFENGQAISEHDIELDLALPYIPPRLRPGIFKTFYSGYRILFGAISQVICDIQDKSQPIAEDIQMNIQLKRSVEFYFNKGGQIAYALDCVLDQLPSHFEMEAIDEAEDALSGRSYGDQDEWLMNKKALPVCANDREFEMVRRLMGLGRMGPYRTTSTGRAGPGGFGFGNMFDDDETDEDEDEDTDEDDIEEDDAEMDDGEDWDEEDDE